MGFFDSIKAGIQGHFDRKREDREMMERLRKEAVMQGQIAFEKEFKKNAKAVAIAKAKKDAAKLSGYQKMVAQNRLRNLNKSDQRPDSIMSRFSGYTQKNLAKREENLKATEQRRIEAKKVREERLSKLKNGTNTTRKSFR